MIRNFKYILLSAAVAAFSVTACTKNEIEQPVGEDGVTIFTGGFIESKISLGEKMVTVILHYGIRMTRLPFTTLITAT